MPCWSRCAILNLTTSLHFSPVARVPWTCLPITPSPVPRYVYARDAERPYILLAVGLDDEAMAEEAAAVTKSPRATIEQRASLFVRGEPAALAALATTYDPNRFSGLDLGILAQRLGAFDFWVAPLPGDKPRYLHYRLVLHRPPRLQQEE